MIIVFSQQVSRSDVFREVTYDLEVTEEVKQFISKSSYLSNIHIEWCWDVSDNDDNEDNDDNDDGSIDKKCNL